MARGQYTRTEEWKRLISEHRKDQHNSPKTEFKKGNIPPFAGRHIPDDITREISLSLKGRHISPNTEFRKGQRMPWVGERNKRIKPNLGKPCPDSVKEKTRLAQKGKHHHPETEFKKGEHPSLKTEFTSARVKFWWEDPDYRAKVIAGRLKNRRPTEPERKLIQIIERNKLPFKYTGDGSFILEGLNPDFIETNGRKIAIDVFGDYWHTLKADRESYTEQGRKAIFAKYGWKLIVIWEREVNSLIEEEIMGRMKE